MLPNTILPLQFDFSKERSRYNIISYKIVSSPAKEMQIDLQVGLDIDSAVMKGQRLDFRRDGNAYFVKVPAGLQSGAIEQLLVYYHIPRPALRPPWDGEVIWQKIKAATRG